MIEIRIQSKDSKFLSLEVKGHANSAPHGEDLVCAAVSATITGAFNAIENIKNFKVELKEGYAFLENQGNITNHDEIVVQTLLTQLETIRESEPKFIKITNL